MRVQRDGAGVARAQFRGDLRDATAGTQHFDVDHHRPARHAVDEHRVGGDEPELRARELVLHRP
jgi:hypothetical protein